MTMTSSIEEPFFPQVASIFRTARINEKDEKSLTANENDE